MIRYIADMHLDHADILAYDNRPYDSVEEMNEALIANWNRVVDEEDLTWILGDFCLGESWRAHLQRLHGRKSLIIGNHDAAERIEAARDCFEEIVSYKEMVDVEEQSGETRHVVLCHYPILGFRDHYFGWTHLYGHVHTSYEWNVVENSKRLLKKLYVRDDICRMVNVGAMLPYMDYTPRTLTELAGQW